MIEKLTGVLVCHKYLDFLEKTLPRNIVELDELIVVTTQEDVATQQFCADWEVTSVITDRLGPKFNRGAALNDGLKLVTPPSWVLIFDADIILPDGFRDSLDLKEDTLYGASRRYCTTKDQWESYLKDGVDEHWPIEWGLATGYFQLFHTSHMHTYPENYSCSAGADNEFKAKFSSVSILPNVVLHLGDHGRGRNWQGRTEPTWPPAGGSVSSSHLES